MNTSIPMTVSSIFAALTRSANYRAGARKAALSRRANLGAARYAAACRSQAAIRANITRSIRRAALNHV